MIFLQVDGWLSHPKSMEKPAGANVAFGLGQAGAFVPGEDCVNSRCGSSHVDPISIVP